MTVLVIAHGTRDGRGVETTYRFADAVAHRLRTVVAVSFVDVLGPTPSSVLAELAADEVTVLPAFLARGHHVRVDVPAQLADAARPVALADALGPSRLLAQALAIRLAEAGATGSETVVLAAAGSTDPAAHRDVEQTARLLSELLCTPVRIAFASASASSPYACVSATIADLRRRRPHRAIAVASYLLADGLFQQRLDEAGADLVARPLGLAEPVIDLACARIAAAQSLTTCRERAGIPA